MRGREGEGKRGKIKGERGRERESKNDKGKMRGRGIEWEGSHYGETERREMEEGMRGGETERKEEEWLMSDLASQN